MKFQEQLQQARKERGWSQEDLAARVQVSRQAVSKWETGDAMPDLPKLLALADALELSLDELCGRERPAADLAPADTPVEIPAIEKPAHRRWLWLALCLVLAVCLAATGLWGWSQRNLAASEEAAATKAALLDNFTVSGVSFGGESAYRITYCFAPSVTGDGFSYQITFTNSEGDSTTFDAPCSGGVCADTVSLGAGGFWNYTVTVSVTDGVNSRNVAVAKDLKFTSNSASWLPLTS